MKHGKGLFVSRDIDNDNGVDHVTVRRKGKNTEMMRKAEKDRRSLVR